MVQKRNSQIQKDLHLLVAQGVLNYDQMARIAARYPTGKWNLLSLVRWFTVIGAISFGLGIFLLVKEEFFRWFELYRYVILESLFTLLSFVFIWAGYVLKHKKGYPQTGAALELLSCFTLTGLTFTLGIHYSTGSGNWPALVGIDLVIFLIMAYSLNNRLVLIYACINCFTWFGGSTGYVSGWGAYWLGMTYPLRFLAVGILTILFSYLHLHVGRKFSHFSRVYLHFGLLVTNLSLWFLSLFGYFTEHVRWRDTQVERFIFSIVWALTSMGFLYWGIKKNMLTFRPYGLVFLLINVYTFYFQFIAYHSGEIWWIHMLIVGGSMIFGGIWLEKKFHHKTREEEKKMEELSEKF